ncbi:MAG: neutral/alkaline non-lysosomal ceramidase N-terminal domain-containing protein [Bryobacterales bacterium]|nr:neutral/alkaline non-lysosomal ceramidase N-terminal domain-containing protein [Bryobacterales bacterium]
MRVLVLILLCALMAAAEFRVGVARVDITPPKGAPMAGYYYNRAAEGAHDPLLATAMVIEREGVRFAIVTCDLLSMPAEIAREARERIARDPGIPATHVVVSATHTHTGPALVAGQIRYNLTGDMLRIGKEYSAGLAARIHEAVAAAAAALQPANLYTARGREDSVTFNRRFWMKDGTVGWNPGKRNPNIVRSAGPVDGDLPVLYAETPDGKPIGVFVNYALHLDTVGGTRYSRDYPYTLARALEAARGEGLVTLFTLGCAGNLNHIDVSSARQQRGNGEAARIGSVLAAAVLKALGELRPVADMPIRVSSREVALPLAPFDPAELAAARAVAATFGTEKPAPFLELVKATRMVSVAERKGEPIRAEVQVLSIGRDVAFVALPGEIFTELGLAIKLASPFAWTSVISLANDSPGYIADRKGYAQGAYEPVSSRVASGSGEMLVEAATLALIEHVRGLPADPEPVAAAAGR